MSAVQEVIGQVRAEREAVATRLAALDDLVVQLERYVELFSPPPAAPVVASPLPQKNGTRIAAAPMPGATINRDEKRTQAILTFLKDGPKATREIAAHLKADRLVVKQALQRLKKALVISSTGLTASQRWVLPGVVSRQKPATLADVVDKSGGPLCIRCQHRFKAHDPVSGACTPPCICREFYA